MSDEQEHKDGHTLPEQPPTDGIFRRSATKIIVVLFFCLGYFLVSQISYQWNDVFDGYYSYVGKNSNGVKNPLLVDSLEYSWELWPYSTQDEEPTLLNRQCAVQVYKLKESVKKLGSLDDVQKYLNAANGEKKSIVHYNEIDSEHYEIYGGWFKNNDQSKNYIYDKKPNEKLNIQAIFESKNSCFSHLNQKGEISYGSSYLKKRLYPFFMFIDNNKEYVNLLKDENLLFKFYADCYESILTYYSYERGVMLVARINSSRAASICPIPK